MMLLVMMMGMIKGDQDRAECIMWSHLENKTMPLQDQGHATCRTNDECSGFSCEGTFKDSPVMFGMRVLHCQEPPGLELFGHAPQFNAIIFLMYSSMDQGMKYQECFLTNKLW